MLNGFSWRAFAALMAIGVVGLVAPGLAAAGWSPIEPYPGFSGTRPVGLKALKTDDGGRFLYWTRDVSGVNTIQAMRFSADGTPGPIMNLTGPTPYIGSDLQAAMSPSGDATVAWLAPGVPNEIVKSVTVPAQGTPGPVLDRSAGQLVEDLSVAVEPGGTVAFSWVRPNGFLRQAQVVTAAGGGASGSVHEVTSLPGNVLSAAITARPEGGFKLAWTVHNMATLWYNVATIDLADDGAVAGGAAANYVFPVERQVTDANDNPVFDAQGKPVMEPFGTTGAPTDVDIGTNREGGGTIIWRRVVNEEEIPEEPPRWFTHAEKSTFPQGGPPGTETMISRPSENVISNFKLQKPAVGRYTATWLADRGGAKTTQLSIADTGGVYVITKGPIFTQVSVDAAENRMLLVGWTEDGLLPGQHAARLLRITRTGVPWPVEFPGFDALKSSSDPVPDAGKVGDVSAFFYGVDQDDVGGFWTSSFSNPGIAMWPPKLNFGTGLLNIENSVRRAYVSNTGETPTTVTDVSLTGADANVYSLVNPAGCLGTLNPGAVCEVPITFKPGQVGTMTAGVQLESNAGSVSADLTGNAVARTRLSLRPKPGNRAVRAGRTTQLRAAVTNAGGLTADSLRVCMRTNRRVFSPGRRCVSRSLGLAVGETWTVKFRVRVKRGATAGRRHAVRFRLRAGNANPRRTHANIRVRRAE